MQLFFDQYITSGEYELPENESKHLVRVLRKTVGDEVKVTNGSGALFNARITEIQGKRCHTQVTLVEEKPAMKPRLIMVIAPTKSTDRMEWFLEKAVELGVSEIIPIHCFHSERVKVKTDRWQRILIAAMKQSLHYHLPKLHEITKFNDLLNLDLPETKLLAHCRDTEKLPIHKAFGIGEDCVIAIGPEGDFSVEEIALSEENSWKSVDLGDRRLRTETAALSSLDAFHWFQNWFNKA
ncbi:MAG: 16S rRNA (uracil(1498)-N(3))-methyltransferase [Flavobacteriales bacterium]